MTCCAQQQQPHLKSSLDTDKRLGLTLKPPDHKHQKTENLLHKNLATLHLGQKGDGTENHMLFLVAQSCLTLCDPMDALSTLHRASPGKNTGVGCHALSFRGSAQPRDRTQVSCTASRFFTS